MEKLERNRKRKSNSSPHGRNDRYDWGTKKEREEREREEEEKKEMEKNKILPTNKKSGLLEKDSKTKEQGIEMKYREPKEAAKPSKIWKIYPFKGEEEFETIPIHNKSCYLIGRDRRVVDIPTDHPSCSLQHSVIQFRKIETEEGKNIIR